MRKEKITPEEYSKILSSLNIQDVALMKANVRLYETKSNGGSININLTDKYSYTQGEDTADFTASFKMEGELVSGENNEKAISISADFKVSYLKAIPLKVTDEFMDVFKVTSLPHVAWPFYREFIQSMTSRMGLPHFTLPNRYFNIKKSNQQER